MLALEHWKGPAPLAIGAPPAVFGQSIAARAGLP